MPKIVASLARTANGTAAPTALGAMDAATVLRVQLNVTAASGTTPSLAVTIEDTVDDVNWNPIGTFAVRTAAGREVINVTTPFADRIRLAWAMTGTTPSFTFDIDAYAQ